MKITILGSGSFFIDKTHSAPSYLIQTQDTNILLDCGPGTESQLAKIDFDPLNIEYIFISHFHADHTSDLLPILMRAYILEKFYGGKIDKNIKIIGPKGIKEFVKKLANIFQHEGLIDFEKIEYLTYDNLIDFDNFEIQPFKVCHANIPAYGLRLKIDNKIISYTGDAVFSKNLNKLVENADLLIADCADPKGNPAGVHMNTTQVGELCKNNNVKSVVLSHQVPPGYNTDVVGEVKEIFSGSVTLAKDLMEINL